MNGIVTTVENHGTIVSLVVRDDAGRLEYVHFDHRPFREMVEARGNRADRILGQRVTVHDTHYGKTVEFEED